MSEMAEYRPRTEGMAPRRALADLAVRLAEPADAAAIAEISAAREGLVAAEIEPRIAGELALPIFGDRHAVWVAESGGEVLGFGRARWDEQAEGTGPRAVPTGWYLMGVVVRPQARRQGIGSALLAARLHWLAERTDQAFSVTSEHNRVSIALLASEGFAVQRRDVTHPRIKFVRGVGLLLRCDLQGLGGLRTTP